MRIFIAVLLLASMTATLHPLAAASRRSPDHFFRPVTQPLPDLPEDRMFPQGKKFLFSMYSVGAGADTRGDSPLVEEEVRAVMQRYYEDGFRFIGPQYEMNDRILEDARRHGFQAIYHVALPMNFLERGGEPALQLSREEIEEGIRELVEAVADDPLIAMWDLGPEELRHWRAREMEYLEVAADAIRKYDPLKRPVYMYDPAHRSARSLAHTARHLDIIGKGTYTNYAGMKNDRIWVRWSMEQQREALEAANPEGAHIAVLEMFQQPHPDELHLIPTWVRHDAYLSLVSGAQGITVFSLRPRRNFEAHGDYYAAWAEVAGEVVGEKNLGQIFLFGERREDIEVDVVDGPATVSMVFRNGGVTEPIEYSSVNYADIAYGDDRFLVLVNSAQEPVSVMVGGLCYTEIVAHPLFEDYDPFRIAEGEFPLELGPLAVKAYRFVRTP